MKENQFKNIFQSIGIKVLLIIILFVFSFIIVYRQMGISWSDYAIHGEIASKFSFRYFLRSIKQMPYPVWHIGVYIVYIITKNIKFSGAFITSIVYIGSYLVVDKVFHKDLSMYYSTGMVSIFSFIMILVGPLYLPSYNVQYYLGQGTPNTWHNPTNPAVRPIGILAFYLLLQILERWDKEKKVNKKELLILAVLLVISELLKPSFIQMFIPGTGLYFLLRLIYHKGENIGFYIRIISAFIPAVILMGVQWILVFDLNDKSGGVAFSWLTEIKMWTPNIFISYFLAFAFPLFVLFVNFKEYVHVPEIQFVWICEFVAWMEKACLIEKGKNSIAGNFGWAHLLTMFFVWMVMLKYFFSYVAEKHKEKKIQCICGTCLLALHVFFGTIYILKEMFVQGFVY